MGGVDKVLGTSSRSQLAKRRWPVSIALLAPLAAILFGGSAVGLKAAPPQSDKCVASGKAPAKNLLPITLHSPSPDASPASPYRAVLDQYCVVCHNEQLRTAGLVLSKVDVANVSEGAAVWEKVMGKLRDGAMPPAGLPRPDQATYDSFAAYLETTLDRAAAATPHPGRSSLR